MQIYDPSLKFGPYDTRPLTSIRRIIIHHTAGSLGDTIQAVHQSHLNQGWVGCGYHYFIAADGSIAKGRPNEAIGAHCYGYNSDSLGVVLAGNFEREKPTAAQLESLRYIVALLRVNYPQVIEVYGHEHYLPTACPGANLIAACKRLGIFWDGQSPAPAPAPTPTEELPYLVRVPKEGSYIYTTPGGEVSAPLPKGSYTIVEEQEARGERWGRLKSGAGWVKLGGLSII